MLNGKLSLCVIEPRFIHMVWPEIEIFLNRALENGEWAEYTNQQLRMILSRGEACLLVMREDNKNIGCVALQILDQPSCRLAHIMGVGGQGVDILWNDFIAWCKSQGVTKIRGYCTPASARLWRKVKAVEVCRVIECTLENNI